MTRGQRDAEPAMDVIFDSADDQISSCIAFRSNAKKRVESRSGKV